MVHEIQPLYIYFLTGSIALGYFFLPDIDLGEKKI